MDEWIKIVSTVGFPIAVTCYVLTRLESAIKENSRQIARLVLILARKGMELDDDK